MKRWRWWLLSGVAAAVLAAGGALVWYHLPQQRSFYTDAETIRQPTETARVRDILWQPPVRLSQVINTTDEDFEPRMSWDGLTLFFVRGKAGDNADIYFCQRTPDGWTEPRPLEDVNSAYDDLGPEPSMDGRSLYFYSDRPGGSGGYDLWVARRTDRGWQPPANLGPAVNSEYNDYGPAITLDGTTLYFASNQPQPLDSRQPQPDAWPATLREDLFYRTYDLYSAPLTERGAGQAQPLGVLNTRYNEGSPCVSPGGDFLYFSSDRPGGEGGFDLYRARRLGGVVQAARNLGSAVNSPANELDPGLTALGYGLYFSSDRPLERVSPEKPNDYNLYYSSSREVFLEVEQFARAPINWAGLLRSILPNLLWALLALLLLLALLALVGDLRRGRLSLLAKCLLASLMVHLLLMMALNLWSVTGSVVSALRGRGPIQIALSPSSGGVALAAQIRGELTDVAAPAAAESAIMREEMETPIEPAFAQTALTVARQALPPEEAAEISPVASDAPPPVPARTPPASVRIDSARGLELAIPAETQRVDRRENHPEFRPATASATLLERPAAEAVASHEPAPQPVGLPPESSGSEITNDVRSFAGAVAPRSAVAPALPKADAPDQSRSLKRSFELTVALPTEAAEPSDAPPEVEPQAAAATREAPHRNVDGPVRTLAASPTLHELQPAPSESGSDDFELVAAIEIEPGDARPEVPQPSASRHPGRRTPDTPRLALTDLALPQVEQSDIAADAEHPLRVSAAALAPPRAAPAALPQQTPSAPTPAQANLPPRSTAAELPNEAPLLLGPPSPRDAEPRQSVMKPPAGIALLPRAAPLDLQVPLPAEVQPPTDLMAQRGPERRQELLEQSGGSEETERAVRLALQWLADHQSPDGHWDGLHFDDGCGRCGGETSYDVDGALTGLSLLCFLGAGHTHVNPGPYQNTVIRGLEWLRAQQESSGDLQAGESMYSHGIAAIALAEACAMTADPQLAEPIARAVRFILGARNQDDRGWRYKPGQRGDTSVFGWQVMALRSARSAGIDIADQAFEEAGRWLERVESQQRSGLYGYRPGDDPTVTMTAEGIFAQQLLGLPRGDPRMRSAVRYISRRLPDWDRRLNTYNWYYTTLALYHHQGPPWARWNQALTEELLANQRQRGRPAGSWDPQGEWAPIGGRVYQTAICTLMLEIYYRYLPMYSLDHAGESVARAPDAVGTIRGGVTDALTGQPIAGAEVRLDLPDAEPLVATAGADGHYALEVPQMPKFFALSAAHPDYVPATASLPASRLRGGELVHDFALHSASARVVPVEETPEVHHLGNDRWEGRINSQFQKTAEGRRFTATFELSAEQLPPHYTRAAVWLMAKGVQCPHEIRINGQRIADRLDQSPSDGSFGEFAAWFDAGLLVEGENLLEIRAVRCRGDLDDFEFVNLQIRLEH